MGKDELKGLDVEEQQLSSKSMGIQRQHSVCGAQNLDARGFTTPVTRTCWIYMTKILMYIDISYQVTCSSPNKINIAFVQFAHDKKKLGNT